MKNKDIIERIKLVLKSTENCADGLDALIELEKNLKLLLEELEAEEQKNIEFFESQEYLTFKRNFSWMAPSSDEKDIVWYNEREKNLMDDFGI